MRRFAAIATILLAAALPVLAAPPSPAPAADRPLDDLRREAAAHERAHRPREAAAAYEAILRRDDGARRVLTQRLVDLYAEAGDPAAALAWARKAMASRPDPEAYLAGVFAKLGQLKESELLLRETLRGDLASARRVPLLWQLAEVSERQGDGAAAVAALETARDAAAGTPQQAAAAARLEALRERTASDPRTGPPAGPEGTNKP
jgi:hypothetical protein